MKNDIDWPDVPKHEPEPYTAAAATRLVGDPAYLGKEAEEAN
jgi:hypothetical protein